MEYVAAKDSVQRQARVFEDLLGRHYGNRRKDDAASNEHQTMDGTRMAVLDATAASISQAGRQAGRPANMVYFRFV